MSSRSLNVALLGNVDPAVYWSTENEYVDAYGRAGHSVDAYHEADPSQWDQLILALENGADYDLVHWTRTKSFADQAGTKRQFRLLVAAKERDIPIIGVHLDRWWGLEREAQIENDPYFYGVDVLFTADGGHESFWPGVGVNHRWLLPAISERWLGLGEPKPEWECDVVFVGGWDNYGHRAWKHRGELIRHLSDWYGDRFLALPRRGQPRIVGRDLNDVYASAKVVVGDSCLVPKVDGSPMTHYCSDRIPETLGRGGLLVHPAVHGINSLYGDPFRTQAWPLNDWAALRRTVDTLIDAARDDDWRQMNAEETVEVAAEQHTYTHRVNEIVDTLTEMGML